MESPTATTTTTLDQLNKLNIPNVLQLQDRTEEENRKLYEQRWDIFWRNLNEALDDIEEYYQQGYFTLDLPYIVHGFEKPRELVIQEIKTYFETKHSYQVEPLVYTIKFSWSLTLNEDENDVVQEKTNEKTKWYENPKFVYSATFLSSLSVCSLFAYFVLFKK